MKVFSVCVKTPPHNLCSLRGDNMKGVCQSHLAASPVLCRWRQIPCCCWTWFIWSPALAAEETDMDNMEHLTNWKWWVTCICIKRRVQNQFAPVVIFHLFLLICEITNMSEFIWNSAVTNSMLCDITQTWVFVKYHCQHFPMCTFISFLHRYDKRSCQLLHSSTPRSQVNNCVSFVNSHFAPVQIWSRGSAHSTEKELFSQDQDVADWLEWFDRDDLDERKHIFLGDVP